ncbi:phosphorylase family protein [Lysobacter sp. A3-1-A15]|uniref:phosphorylase family protein n=1 Tax=Novilysobacter viscosus TaxID=3098602 RepID=UPI002ED98152
MNAEDIFFAYDAASARRALRDRYYDLMLLDVLLPARDGASPAGDVSADFLREIVEDETSPSPGRVVAITSELGAIDAFDSEFRNLVTQILHVDPGVDTWKYSLGSLVSHVRSVASARMQFDYDVCIQATLRAPELSAVLALPGISWLPEEPLSRGLLFRRGEMEVGGRKLKLACAHATQMGLVPAAHLASQMINCLRPRVLIMTGICGSVNDSTLVGDIIVADKSWDWQAGKWTADGSLCIAPDQKEASSELVALARGVDEVSREWYERYENAKPAARPTVRVAPVASGSAVVADSNFQELFKRQHRKVDGIDMECYGFYHSAIMADEPNPLVLCIKAVSDKADSTKSDDFQGYCSHMSAMAAQHVFRRYFESRWRE